MSGATRILGIDPGSRITGFGIVDSSSAGVCYVASGCIRTEGVEFAPRLRDIFVAVRSLVEQHAPHEIAIEKVFMHRNADSALKLGQARSAAICGTFGSSVGIHEYAARAVKQALVGQGGAEKPQVQHMVKMLLGIANELSADEADALAVAICHAQSRTLRVRLAAQPRWKVVRR